MRNIFQNPMKYKAFGGVLLVCFFAGWMPRTLQQDNTPPKVVIANPTAKESFNWNELVRYSITVEDKEDGSSAYEEIAPNEVFLKVQFVSDSAKLKAIRAAAKTDEPRELTLIKSGDCLNCHAFKSKVIGPSFETMAKQYATKADAVTLLSKKVVNGSAATTGTEKMPAHPDLANGHATAIVRWILKNAADPNVDYLRGLEGSFRTQVTPPKNATRAVYLLTASYTDHGLPDEPATRKQGRYTVVLRGK
jgi:cytochrome c